MTGIRNISISLIAVSIVAGAIHAFRILPFETQQAVAAGVGMVLGMAMLGLACWAFPKIRMEIVKGVGDPNFLGPFSIAALLGGFAGHRIFTIMMVGWAHG
jgi:hypothetical protein